MAKLVTAMALLLGVTVLAGPLDFVTTPLAIQGSPAMSSVAADDSVQAQADRLALVKGNTTFACDLYGKLREKGNVVFSPYSLSTALGMTQAGARGQTAEQMAQVLGRTLPPERLNAATGALQRELVGPDDANKRPYQLHVANALWGQKGYDFLDDYVTLLRTSYGASLAEVDFGKERAAACQTINDWVAKQTQDKIKELVQEEHLTPDTRLVLTNAIYFKADWESKFAKGATKVEPFHVAADRKIEVPLMSQTGKFAYLDDDTFQMLELPYTGDDLAMLLLLPKQVGGLAELEKTLTADKLGQWQNKLREREVKVFVPRFKVTAAYEVKNVLTALGMELPFSAKADFSEMNGGREPLMIAAVVHKTFVAVNEEGTEAAGATAMAVGRSGLGLGAATFRADHPFLFLVRDKRSGSILFIGRVVDPSR